MVDGVFSIPAIASGGPASVQSGAEKPVRAYIGDATNQHVHVAWQAVFSDDPMLNPLLIYGPSGTGKTLLLESIFSGWQTLHPAAKCELITGADFARQFGHSVDAKEVPELRARWRSVGLLAVDGLDQLVAKRAAQQELVATMDDLLEQGGRVLVTSTLMPLRNPGYLPQLASRLVAGLAIPALPPGPDARRYLLDQFASRYELEFSDEALAAVEAWCGLQADPVTVPRLQQLVQQLAAAQWERDLQSSRSQRHVITAEQLAPWLTREPGAAPSVSGVATIVATHLGVPLKELRGSTRRHPVVRARSTAMYLARQTTTASLQQIGQYFGKRDHTTVMHACRKMAAAVEQDSTVQALMLELKQRIYQRPRGEAVR